MWKCKGHPQTQHPNSNYRRKIKRSFIEVLYRKEDSSIITEKDEEHRKSVKDE